MTEERMATWSVLTKGRSYDPVLVEVLRKSEGIVGSEVHNLYVDTLVSSVGNRLAYSKIADREAVHVRADLIDFADVNRTYGFVVGDVVLEGFGRVASEVASNNGGQSYRYGGDEFHFLFPTPEDAHMFCRSLRMLLEKKPLLDGWATSAAFGIGGSAYEAIEALQRAQASLKSDGVSKYEPGTAPSVFYSMFAFDEPAPLNKSEFDPDDPKYNVVDSKAHIIKPFGTRQGEHDIVHGLDFRKPDDKPPEGAVGGSQGPSRWLTSAGGRKVIVKRGGSLDYARAEAAFRHLADSVFGLGEFVPETTAFRLPHPKFSEGWAPEYSAQEVVEGGKHVPLGRSHPAATDEMLHRVGMMDYVLGNEDRVSSNYLWTDKGIRLIDNSKAFAPSIQSRNLPRYLTPTANWHPAALDLVNSIDEEKLREFLNSIRDSRSSERFNYAGAQAVNRLRTARKMTTRDRIIDLWSHRGW